MTNYFESKIKARVPATVIDLGSFSTKCGQSGEDMPRHFVSSIFGSIKAYTLQGNGIDYFIGDEALTKSDPNSIYNPFDKGYINNREDIERLLNFIFDKELNITQEKKSIILSTPLLGPNKQKELITEIVFEHFKASSLFISSPPNFALYTYAKFTATVVEIGHSFTQITSIFDQTSIPQASIISPLGGSEITNYFQRCLKDLSHQFNGPQGKIMASQLKESFCYIAGDSNPPNTEPIRHKLSEDIEIELGDIRYKCPEILFNPSLGSIKSEPLHELIYESIMRCDIEIRPLLFNNILLTGGSSLLPGLAERLTKELKMYLRKQNINLPVNVVTLPNRQYAAYIGASVFGSLKLYKEYVIYSEEYDEHGPTVIHKRFY